LDLYVNERILRVIQCVSQPDMNLLVYKPNTSFSPVCANIGVLLGIACVKTKDKLDSVCQWSKGGHEFIGICIHRD